MEKTKVNNVCVGAWFCQKSNPSNIFVDRKFQYPIPAIDGRLAVIGGNWFGLEADNDEKPLGTLVREVSEELSLKHGKASMAEMGKLDNSGVVGEYQTPQGSAEATPEDIALLERIRAAVIANAEFFNAYVITTKDQYFWRADPADEKARGIVSLACYYAVPLEDELWAGLARLQAKFGNLSSESVTVMTFLGEMLAAQRTETDPYKRFDFAWAHGWAVKEYFISKGFVGARELELPYYTDAELVVTSVESYADILERFEVAKMPPKYQNAPA